MNTTQDTEVDIVDSISLQVPHPGDIVEGIVVEVGKGFITLSIFDGNFTGIIKGRELIDSFETAKKAQEGETLIAAVIEDEDDEGTLLLSFRKASQVRAWERFEQIHEDQSTIEVTSQEANKGGLLLMIDGIKGFLPVSQLAPHNYPRVDGADSSQILSKLQKLVGVKFAVKIINLDEEGNKMVLSERATSKEAQQKELSELRVGQIVKGKVTGVVKFGVFVHFGHLEGLVHISEIAWGHVSDAGSLIKVGDELEVLIIGVAEQKISLSIKQLTSDPWEDAVSKFQKGSTITGKVQKFVDAGILINLGDGVTGLIHSSEISREEIASPAEVYKIGEELSLKVLDVDTRERRVSLSAKALETVDGKKTKKTEKAEEETAEERTEEEEVVEKKPTKKKGTPAKKEAKEKSKTEKKETKTSKK